MQGIGQRLCGLAREVARLAPLFDQRGLVQRTQAGQPPDGCVERRKAVIRCGLAGGVACVRSQPQAVQNGASPGMGQFRVAGRGGNGGGSGCGRWCRGG